MVHHIRWSSFPFTLTALSDATPRGFVSRLSFETGTFYMLGKCCCVDHNTVEPLHLGFWINEKKRVFNIFAQLKLNSQKTETIYISPLTRWEGQSFHIYKFCLIHSLLWVLSGSLLCLSCFAVVRSNSTSTRILHILPVCFETVIPTLSVPFGLPDFQEVSHWKNLKISG